MAAISDLRTQFKEVSGRYDLSDARLDFLINAGIQWLDDHSDLIENRSFFEQTVSVGQATVEATDVKSVRSLRNRTEPANKINFLPFDRLLRKYPKLELTDQGTTSHWSINHRSGGTNERNKQLIILPPTDTAFTLRVYYNRYMGQLSDSQTTNLWSDTAPDVVLLAALFKYELLYGNTARAAHFKLGIEEALEGFDISAAQEQLAMGNVLEPVRELDDLDD